MPLAKDGRPWIPHFAARILNDIQLQRHSFGAFRVLLMGDAIYAEVTDEEEI
jgi:hypothetical protein